MTSTAEIRACAVCGRMLDYLSGSGFMHSAQDQPEDHPAVPVTLDEIESIGRCDFCNRDFPGWEVPARTFQAGTGATSVGSWSACDTCADLVRAGRWDGLLRRVAPISAARNGVPVSIARSMLQPLYNTLRKNVTGPVRRASR